MRMQLIKTVFLLLASLGMLGACSIYDQYPDRMQRSLHVELRDSVGDVMSSDSASDVVYLYYFVNGIYQGRVARDADGHFRLVYSEGDSITYVAVAGKDTTQYDLNVPQPGDRISNVWLQLHARGSAVSPQPAPIYYGQVTASGLSSDDSEGQTLELHDIRSHVRVWVRGLRRRFGDGKYRIVIEGLHGGLAYDGTTGGEYVNYEMRGGFDAKGDWKTAPVTVLPSTGSAVNLKIYKEDGTLLFDRTEDEEGKPLAIPSGEDVVLIVNASYQADLTIRVVPYEDVMNENVFQ